VYFSVHDNKSDLNLSGVEEFKVKVFLFSEFSAVIAVGQCASP